MPFIEDHVEYYGDPPSRALFDMAAVAIVKNPDWAESYPVPSPIYISGKWVERPGNSREIIVWEHFDKAEILKDFYATFENYNIATPN